MFDYKTFQDIHVFFQQELDLAKSNLEKAKKSDALNFDGFIEPNERVFEFYEETDKLYIEALFYNNIENEEELLKEAIDWLTEANRDLVKFNIFCSKAREMGDLKESVRLTDILFEILNEKKSDRCKRIADRRYSKPSAYKSGAIVRCRKGDIWKDIKEEIKAEEAHNDEEALQTVVDGKRNIGAIALKNTTIFEPAFWDIIEKNNLKTLKVPSNPHRLYIFYRENSEKEANELKDIAEKYGGYFAYNATEEDSRRIGQLLGYKSEDIEDYIERNKKYKENDILEEKETLRTWFKRKGAAGKVGGWVDCNTCRKDKKTDRKKCKPCGRQKGEKRAKYPSCRPTPSQCSDPGKGKSWGKTK